MVLALHRQKHLIWLDGAKIGKSHDVPPIFTARESAQSDLDTCDDLSGVEIVGLPSP